MLICELPSPMKEMLNHGLCEEDRHALAVTLDKETNGVAFWDFRHGDRICVLSYTALWRASESGLRDFMTVVKLGLADWRRRLYDYDHVAEGVYEGDLL